MSRRFLLAPSLATTALLLLAALGYPLVSEWLAEFARRFYGSTDHFLYPFLAARVEGYRTFLWVLTAILAIWCAVLGADPRLKAFEASLSRPAGPAGPAQPTVAWVAASVALLATAVVAVLLSDREWKRFGQPCWDNYCLYSTLASGWLRDPSSDTWTALHAFMRSDYHCNSPLVPVLVAGTMLATGIDVVTSYRVVCGAATVLALVLLFWFLRSKRGVAIGRTTAMILLVASNIAVIRSSCFPQTDAFVFLWITLAITQSVLFLENPTRPRAAACVAILTSGLFIKLSFLPALAIIPLWTALEARAINRDVVHRAVVFALGPLLVFLVFQLSLGLVSMYGREFNRMQTEDSFAPFHVISLLHVGAVLVPLVIIGRQRLTKTDFYVLIWTGIYLLSLWGGRTSGWDRFYLAIVPPLAIAGRHGIAALSERLSTTTAVLGIALYALANDAALLLNLYQ